MTNKARIHLDPMTPVTFLERSARVFPDKTAVVYEDLRWTYREFSEQVGRMAGALLLSLIHI